MNKYNLLFLIAVEIPLILRLGFKYDLKNDVMVFDTIDKIYFILWFILLVIFSVI